MPPPSSKHRTNSLAFAKTDCHTCSANQRRCDRKRPRCSSCLGKNIVCGGYPMQLTWSEKKQPQPRAVNFLEQIDDPFHLEPLSLQASIHVKDRNARYRAHKPRNFRFVTEEVGGRKHPSTGSSEACRKEKHFFSGAIQESVPIQKCNISVDRTTEQGIPGIPLLAPLQVVDHASSPTFATDRNDVLDPLAMLFLTDPSSDLRDYEALLNELDSNHNTMAMSDVNENAVVEHRLTPTFNDPQQNLTPLGSPILHKSLIEKFETLLNLYDQDFCIVPLSGDVPSNPFRYQLDNSSGSQSLLHAILAVSCYHAGRQTSNGDYPSSDVINHQNTAVKLYHEELNSFTGPPGVQILDTTMVLFLYNATQCAFSNWTARISEAGKILNLFGGAQSLVNSPRIQAQIVMLLWWDATIALLSRQGCVLSYSYFEAVLALEDNRNWSFFDLIGCPRELVVPLMQLASLAEENEKVSSMRWARFDLTPIDEIQAFIISWENPSPIIDDEISEEQMQRQRDRWNCTEAWRYGLLIYITRVFRWDRKTNPPLRLALYARLVLEHVNSCRRTAIVQKQAFLPLFFASCETKDQFSRQSVREYCQYWGGVCGYDLFRSAAALLEDVWREQDGVGGRAAWWGSVVDEKQRPYLDHEEPMQFCFG
ncbi:hypothetical protein L207DRAFT_554328 [Hyaloscypha variabilis F]|uniref:Zn(2)-C6 fungal-type domain-containing protein n=1 Tax=Hyaloscypha variabilis (strain UAMH 11265 / GT02V1 / F) TaxID=1149755 RepID=A0A2J6RQ33_HYAVF|nr:hypothetical protein L207DRAFT_554328 [Hyaloscypha variabilis F]